MRKLGPTESFFAWGNARFGAFTVSAAVRLSGRLDVDRMIDSIEAVKRSDELLSAEIQNPLSLIPRFQPSDVPLPGVRVLNRESCDQWQAEFKAAVQRPFALVDNCCRELCDFTIIGGEREHELLIRIHHSICDGIGLVNLVHRILRGYAQPIDTTKTRSAIVTEPAMESRIPLWLRAKATSNLMITTALANLRRKPPPTPVDANTAVSMACLGPDECAALIDLCRTNRTTVNSALATTCLIAGTEALKTTLPLTLQTNVDLRHLSADESDTGSSGQFSYWVENTITDTNVARSDFWECARRYKSETTQAISRHGVPPLGFCLLAKPFLAALANSNRAGRTSDLTLSNLGVLELDAKYDGLSPIEFFFASSQSGIGSKIVLTAGSTGGKLCLSCMSQLGDEVGFRFLDQVIELCRTPDKL